MHGYFDLGTVSNRSVPVGGANFVNMSNNVNIDRYT